MLKQFKTYKISLDYWLCNFVMSRTCINRTFTLTLLERQWTGIKRRATSEWVRIPLQTLTNKAPQNLRLVSLINSKKIVYCNTATSNKRVFEKGFSSVWSRSRLRTQFFITFRKIKKCFLALFVKFNKRLSCMFLKKRPLPVWVFQLLSYQRRI